MDLMTQETPRLVNLPHPLVDEGRQVSYLPFTRNETLGGYVKRAGIEVSGGPLAVQVNGQPVADWRRYRVKQGDHIVMRAAVRGGGNGGKILRAVAMIAIMVVAWEVAPYLTGEFGVFAGASDAVIAGSIMIGGSMLVNALLPPPTPDLGGLSSGSAETSPTYALNGGRNRARLFEPLPLVIGTHRIVPDAAGLPYTEYAGDDQYLYQAFHFGLQPSLALTEFRIGDTALDSFTDVTREDAGTDGQLTLLAGNVDTLTGFDLRSADGWVQRTSSADAVKLAVELAAVLYFANDAGGLNSRSAEVELEFRAVGATLWQPLEGTASLIALSNAATKPLRRTVTREVPRGQYELRFRKITVDETSTRASNAVTVAQIRSFQADDTDYTGQRRVALKVRATAQLNGAIDELSALATAQCPVWTGSAWVTQVTQNPAWWYLWFARGKFDAAGRRVYGGGLPDSRIDLAAIKAWGAWCDANNLTVSMVVDRAGSTAEVLNRIARCGRGSMTWQTGRLGVVWDAADLPVVAVFGPANILAGSMEIDYIGDQTADEVIVSFVNRNTWQADQVRKTVPGVVNPSNPVTLDFVGCTDPAMAGREANLIAASQIHHRRRVSWETDVEGMVATRGDVVLLSHDMASWSYSGRLMGGTRSALTLDKAVPLGANAWVGIRFPDGRYATYRVQSGSGESDVIQLTDLIPASDGGGPLPVPGDGGAVALDWLWFYEVGATPGRRVKIVDVKPSGDNVRFTAVDDVPAYYASENGDFQGGTAVESYLPPVVGYLNLSESSRVTADGRRLAVLLAHWPPLSGATHYLFRYRRAGGAWAEISVPDVDTELDVEPGVYEAQVTAVFRSSRSAAAVASITIQGNTVAPAAAPIFTATGEPMQIVLRWSWPDVAGLSEARLYARTGSNPMTLLAPVAYPQASWTHLGLATGVTVDYELRLVDSWGNVSAAKTASATTVKDPSILLEQLKSSVTREAFDDLVRSDLATIRQIGDTVLPQLNAVSEANGEAALRLLLQADARADEARRNRKRFDAIIDVDPLTGQIRLKATAEITTDVDAKIRDVQLLVDALNGQLTGTVSTVTQQGGRLTAAESSLQLLQSELTLSVQQAYAYTDSAVSGAVTDSADALAQAGTLGDAQLRALLEADRQAGLSRAARFGLAQARLDIKANADAIAAEASARLTLATRMGVAEAGLVSESLARSTGDAALSQQITTLSASIQTETSQRQAAIQTEQSARANADGALSTRIDTAQAKADQAAAAVTSEATSRASADTALGQRIDTVQASAAGNAAAIQAESSARADAVAAVSQQVTTVQALAAGKNRTYRQSPAPTGVTTGDEWIDTGNGSLRKRWDGAAWVDVSDARTAGNAAAIQSEATARADADGALSSRIDTAQAAADDAAAAVQTEATARASAVDGVLAKWSVKIIVTADGQQRVAGISLLNGSGGSSFAVLADQFAVALPNGNNPKQVFTIGSLNGGPAVGIAGDLILDGAMTARHVSADAANFVLLQAKTVWANNGYIGSLSELSSNLGIAVKGRLQNHADQAQATAFIDLDATGTDPFLSVKQNGVETVRVQADGGAEFARTVISAPNIVASGAMGVDSGWLSGGEWGCLIDTGVTVASTWWEAVSDQYGASATISGGQSQSGGFTGHSSSEVWIGDGLETSPYGQTDNRIYIMYRFRPPGGVGSRQIRITQLTWKLVRL